MYLLIDSFTNKVLAETSVQVDAWKMAQKFKTDVRIFDAEFIDGALYRPGEDQADDTNTQK